MRYNILVVRLLPDYTTSSNQSRFQCQCGTQGANPTSLSAWLWVPILQFTLLEPARRGYHLPPTCSHSANTHSELKPHLPTVSEMHLSASYTYATTYTTLPADTTSYQGQGYSPSEYQHAPPVASSPSDVNPGLLQASQQEQGPFYSVCTPHRFIRANGFFTSI